MVQTDSKSRLSNQFPGFSDRFNLFLDKANFASLEYGRARALAERFEGSKSGARKWIREDTPPRHLRDIVESICEDLPGNYDRERLLAWLYHGDAAENPFEPAKRRAKQVASPAPEIDHTLLSAVYIKVHEHAKELGINLQKMNAETLDMIYQPLIAQVQSTGINSISSILINSLLTLASKN